ncbi:MAG: RluA family pseudouridine synthase [Patescibacteria group bacterium]|jgi:23S rRNA pseudouridine1911/1915/1917 synthase|nr:RluA family pseudouridine synthase [Patescibacteria group bacterium]
MIEIKITGENKGTRTDKFLAEELPANHNIEITRSQIQKLINDDSIKINDKTFNSSYRLKEGDVINIIKTTSKEKDTTPALEKLNLKIEDIIIKETEDYIIINKPAGIIVHEYENIMQETLVDVLLGKYPELRQIGEDPARPGIVHRIDREVSGLMVIARNQDSFDSLKEQFKDRSVQKYYKTLVYGEIVKDYDEIRFPITRSKSRYKMAALPETVHGEKQDQGKIAISEFDVIERRINYTMLKVKIKTGRTHQIRVHLSAYGNPLVGDDVYTTNKLREKNKKKALGRIFLVAYHLSFKDLKGEQQTFEIDLPEVLTEFLKTAK